MAEESFTKTDNPFFPRKVIIETSLNRKHPRGLGAFTTGPPAPAKQKHHDQERNTERHQQDLPPLEMRTRRLDHRGRVDARDTRQSRRPTAC